MPENPLLGRRLLHSGRRIRPLIAAAAPHDPLLAEQVGGLMLDDVMAMVDAMPTNEEIATLPAEQRVAVLTEIVERLQQALWQVEDARTLVDVARDEARP